MKDEINEFLVDLFELDKKTKIEFRKLYGFTFAFKTTILKINSEISSAEIRPVGIIYEENDEYYFAPLDKVTKKEEIIKKYVEDFLI